MSWLWIAALTLTACDATDIVRRPDFDLNRMIEQPRADAFEPSPFFADGRTVRNPPEKTVARDAIVDNPALTAGYVGQHYVEAIPMSVDYALIARGRDRFEIFCAACHGLLGDGDSAVGRAMPSIRPRSLHEDRLRASPPGRLYRVVSEGYGLMNGYAVQLPVRDRWAVVAYVRSLQASRAYDVARLSPAERKTLEMTP